MAGHLRFDSKTGRVESKSPHGKHTEELLQLNDDAVVQYRLNALKIIQIFSAEIAKQELQLKTLPGLLRSGKISQAEYDLDVQDINQHLAELRHTLQAQTGELPLPPLRAQRQGIVLLSS